MAFNSRGSGYTVDEIYRNALHELQTRKAIGCLTESDFDIIARSTRLQDVLDILKGVIQSSPSTSQAKGQIRRIGTNIFLKLERYGTAIDMLAQSSPQIMGLGLIGLIWGSLKFLIIFARDLSNMFSEVLDIFYDLLNSLPTTEIYVELFGSSSTKMLKAPLTDLFVEFARFALLAIQLYDRSVTQTIWRSKWTSLRTDLEECIKRINKVSKEIDRLAQIEHMVQASEEAKNQRLENQQADNFRQEMRRLLAQLLSNTQSIDQESPLLPFNDSPAKLQSNYFTGREEELDQISNAFQPKMIGNPLSCNSNGEPPRCAIYGMPGMGKTQLVLKYAALSFEAHRYSFIFWLSAASIEKLNQGVSKLLTLVGHPDRYQPDQSISLLMAKRWLESQNLNNDVSWLLVVDNVHESAIKYLQDFLPTRNMRGNILITTRTKDIAGDIVDMSRDQMIALQVPNLRDAANLFLRTAGVNSAGEQNSSFQLAESLVKCVGRLPFAVVHAASFLKESRKTSGELLSLYNSKEKIKLLSWKIPSNNPSPYEERSVVATPRERFQQLATHPDAKILLQMLSFLDPDSIQLGMINRGCNGVTSSRTSPNLVAETYVPAAKSNFAQKILKRLSARDTQGKHDQTPHKKQGANFPESLPMLEELSSLILSPAQFQAALDQLKDLSLVTFLDDSPTLGLQIHDLTKFMVQEMTMSSDTQAALFVTVSAIICSAFRLVEDRVAPKCWPECDAIVPHIESLTKWITSRNKTNPEIAWANVEVAGYFRTRGRYKDAERLYRQALGKPGDAGYYALSPAEDAKVSRGLAGVLVRQGQYNEAETLYQRGLAGNKILSPESDLESLITAQGLIELYDKQGRYKKAIELGEIILDGMRQKATKITSDLLRTMHNLGLAYGHQAQFDKAEEMFLYVMKESEKMGGPDHPETLRTTNALANLYDRRGRYDQSATLYMRAIEGREKRFGSSHPQTLRSECGLANLYMRRGLLEEAEILYKRALHGSELYFAEENPDVLRAVHGIAAVLTCQGKLTEAEGQFERAIAGRTHLLGKDHADTLRSIEGLAMVFDRSDQYEKAVELYTNILVVRTKLLGTEHPETLMVAQKLEVLEDKRRGNSTMVV